ncbi:hypothetical protein LOC71_16940 [Rhodopirellula sp. JC740]|uniref:DUF2029 domain-containing protein n=1 Tax=Rhodopirellula halodulae TaxID=2894198 RepID=A0ABS8NKD7_9BACT|nr:hypothetical protein [Rhodopirellula sp. JC740]MCC9643971.1 hypothetical protein [Rhodopirellula sp. JC740]
MLVSLREGWSVGNRVVAIVAGLFLAVGLAGTFVRVVVDYQVPGPFDPEHQGLCDFHNGIYFPTRAVLQGESPYSDAYAAKYPVARQIPFFSPVILLMHAPLAVLPLHVGEFLNAILQLFLLASIAILVAREAGAGKRLDVVFSIAAAMVFSRGGHITLFNGYFTYQLVLATFLSLVWADRHPVRAAWALLVVSAKPTYILPLGFLMLARGNARCLVLGAVFSILGAVVPLAWIAHHEGDGDLVAGVSMLKQQIVDTQAVHRSMDDESPVYSWTRLDLFAIIAKWRGEDPGDLPHILAMAGLLVIPMFVLFRRWRAGCDDGISGVTGGLLLTAMLVSLYHQSYDSLLLIAPVAGLCLSRLPQWARLSVWSRVLLFGLMAFPAINYLSTRTFLLRFELPETAVRVFTSLNGISLALALVSLCFIAWPRKTQETAE